MLVTSVYIAEIWGLTLSLVSSSSDTISSLPFFGFKVV